MSKVKITVLKKMNNKDLYGDNPPATYSDIFAPECKLFSVGQQIICDSPVKCPPDFCGWAYADIHKALVHIMSGGNDPLLKDKGVSVVCCTDGLRPVFFKLERIEG